MGRSNKPPIYLQYALRYFLGRGVLRFEAHCQACNRRSHVYLENLLVKLGADMALENVPLKCTRCRSRDCTITPDVDYRPEGKVMPFPRGR